MKEAYSRTHPFLASVKTRHSLCLAGSEKETQHLEIDISGSNIQYSVGDSIAVLPLNDPEIVKEILNTQKSAGSESIQEPKTSKTFEFSEFLERHANLADCTRKLVDEVHRRQSDPKKKEFYGKLLNEEGGTLLKEYLHTNDILDLLQENPEVVFSPQELVSFVKPMMPRFYSISSSQKAVGNEVHLTVVLQKWEARGRVRRGVCSHFLSGLVPLGSAQVPLYLHPHRGFTLPEDTEAPIIMVGPGTGVAPFRAFMQEREFLQAKGKNWLFFGEWTRSHHYFYQDYWENLQRSGKMRMDVAFSRDQEHKVYVQHKMLENGKELFRWLEEGAYFFVCGDASRMSKEVDAALHEIVRVHGGLTDEKTKEYIKALRHSKRYLKDVY